MQAIYKEMFSIQEGLNEQCIAELQYKDPDTFSRRNSSTGSLAVGSVGDYYHRPKKKSNSRASKKTSKS